MAPQAEQLRLFDSFTREIHPLRPADGETFRFYCCGPTVYGPAHIGNFRAFVLQDLLRRTLEHTGLKTRHVRNITDLDDKTIRDSQVAGKSLAEFTSFWKERFHADCRALNLLEPHIEPSAVEHIPHQIRMIAVLIDRGNAYQGEDGSVYFKVDSFPEYGRLSQLDSRELRTGAAPSANDADEYEKESLADFALWKARKPEDGDNYWESPWGEGRPGWHLECSAMALEYLGESFDLHAGGIDLAFPHHENEIAQSCCATSGSFAGHWFHNAHLLVEGGKMSKSFGNLYTLADLQERGYTANELRYLLIGGHYRKPLNFTFQSLDAAREALGRIARFVEALSGGSFGEKELFPSAGPGPFQNAWEVLLHDLNSQGALGQVFKTIKQTKPESLTDEEKKETLAGLGFLLESLGLVVPDSGTVSSELSTSEVPEEIAALAQARWEAKQAKNWGEADRLRDALAVAGWTVVDNKEGFSLEPK